MKPKIYVNKINNCFKAQKNVYKMNKYLPSYMQYR